MSSIWLKITLEEPLLVGGLKPDTNFLGTLSYIPGRVLRGALAEWLILQGRKQEIASMVNDIQIGNFLPTIEQAKLQYISPFLLSSLQCKREGNFQSIPGKKKGHGVVDTLLPHLTYHLLQKAGADFAVPFTVNCAESECDSRMEGTKGFYAVYQDRKTKRYIKVTPHYYTQTKAAISRYRRATVENMLYTTTALSPNLVFIGKVNGVDENIETLIKSLHTVSLGSLRTRGYGKVKVSETESPNIPTLIERVETFNILLTQLWTDIKRLATHHQALPNKPEGIYFSVDLMAPAIFRQKGIPMLVPTLNFEGQTLEPIFWFTRPGFAGGWSTVWGLPKPTALMAQMGSVYVFRWDGALETLLPYLEKIEAMGVGERRSESFGECLVCHPFHKEIKEV